MSDTERNRGQPAIRSANTLPDDQGALVRLPIGEKRPEQMKMEFALWDHAAVIQSTEHGCGIKLFIRAAGNRLKRWCFTPQKPITYTVGATRQKPSVISTATNRQGTLDDHRRGFNPDKRIEFL